MTCCFKIVKLHSSQESRMLSERQQLPQSHVIYTYNPQALFHRDWAKQPQENRKTKTKPSRKHLSSQILNTVMHSTVGVSRIPRSKKEIHSQRDIAKRVCNLLPFTNGNNADDRHNETDKNYTFCMPKRKLGVHKYHFFFCCW